MNPLNASAEVKTSVQVLPTHSQVYLVAAAVLAAIIVICGTVLLMAGHQGGWGFLFLAAAVITADFWAWQKSQSDTDMHQAHATQITLANGTCVTTDGRMLKSAKGLHGLTSIIQEMLTRQPLPEPDGLVDANVKVIPNSAANAISLTSKINSETQITTNSLIDILGLADANQKNSANLNMTQHAGAADPPPDEEIIQDASAHISQTGSS
ncbi:MAG: hypothetical protein PHG47_07870 [Sulfuricella sp.]|nr:hypothetical protein [Sulfuricella sp.]